MHLDPEEARLDRVWRGTRLQSCLHGFVAPWAQADTLWMLVCEVGDARRCEARCRPGDGRTKSAGRDIGLHKCALTWGDAIILWPSPLVDPNVRNCSYNYQMINEIRIREQEVVVKIEAEQGDHTPEVTRFGNKVLMNIRS